MTSLIPTLLEGRALDTALADVAEDAERTLAGADGAGAVVHRGAEVLRASSDPLSATVDAAQYGLGQGPCLHAYRTGRLVLLDLGDLDRRWPLFQDAALAAGARTVLSVPLRLDDQAIGSLNLYSRARGAFGARVVRQAELFARPCALRLAHVGVAVHAADVAEVASLELQDRGTIDRALGVLMGIHSDASV
ncbi:MAG TPA: GAF domain-containing protein, partial [Friedmanniella sp.]